MKKYTKKNVLNFLRNVSVMSISANLKRRPISSIVVFYVDNDFSFYFATRRSSFKARALINNPKISLSVWQHKQMLVQAYGKARETADQSEYDQTMNKLMQATRGISNFVWPLLRLKGSENIVFKIDTEWLRVLDLSDDRIANESPFTTIIN